MNGNSVPFSPVAGARDKIVLVSPPGALFHRIVHSVRSLQESEHIAAETLVPEGLPANSTDNALLDAMRRWYWGRRRGRGFLLTGFPATLEHALVLDEWMDSRDETLTACIWIHQSYAEAMVAAERTFVCPVDGRVECDANLPALCALCGSPMSPAADQARKSVDQWFRTVGCHEAGLVHHYDNLGLLQRLDVAAPDPVEAAS